LRKSKRKQRQSQTLPTERPPLSGLTVKIFITIADELDLDIFEIKEDTIWKDIGLDSLMALTISDRLRRELSIEAESSMFSTYPTVKALRTHYDVAATGNAAKDAETQSSERDSWPEYFSEKPSLTFGKDSDTFSSFNMNLGMMYAADMGYYGRGAAREPESSGASTPIYGMEYGSKEDAAVDDLLDHDTTPTKITVPVPEEARTHDDSIKNTERTEATMLRGPSGAEAVRRSRRRYRSSNSSGSRRWRSDSSSVVNDRGLVGLGAAALAAAAAIAAKPRARGLSDRRHTRSRSESWSADSLTGNMAASPSPDHRTSRAAKAGVAGAALGGLIERARSKSRGRDRSRSRIRLALPTVAAGLGPAALTRLHAKNRKPSVAASDGKSDDHVFNIPGAHIGQTSEFDKTVDFSDISDEIQVLDARGVQESDGRTPFSPQDVWQGRERESEDGFGDATEEPGDWEKPVFINEKQFLRILKRRVARQKLEEQFESSKPSEQKSAADDGCEDLEPTAEGSLKQPCSKDAPAPSAIKTDLDVSPDETSLALANTSLDFSLLKMIAPKKCQGLEKETPYGIDAAR
jgi:acyl carrier protein